MTPTDAEAKARAYYDAIDSGDYDRLAALLRPEFVHYRPDRTLEGRDAFVRFMRDERPMTDTTHAVDGVYPEGIGVAVRGRLRGPDGEDLFAFVDVFGFEDGAVAALETYTETLDD
ncbi:nuclear transport factor 2 family protein [Haloparvum sedimenti]|uniref:nuclear transport factor 2 family protein n=1 Tax=Haloparvum sedimenti TaxID=1678448 RepID=UPI00071E7F79|nr:nuclear transport factor 2 family protein [Haloparvum sedimenti]